jgi:hypothetical protein
VACLWRLRRGPRRATAFLYEGADLQLRMEISDSKPRTWRFRDPTTLFRHARNERERLQADNWFEVP